MKYCNVSKIMKYCPALRYTTQLFTHSGFYFIEKKAFQRRIKESPWRSSCIWKTVFETTVTCNNQSIRVIFEAPSLVLQQARKQQSGVRQTKFW